MSQYIEREKFLKKSAECFGHFGVLVKAIEEIADECTTADVVPKSEVEELITENESLAKTVNEASELIYKLRSKVKKSKYDVAMEIFEDIENVLSDCGLYGRFSLIKISELKKKYTESENG